jgi:Protein of unknown function (DUF4058)
VAVYDWTLVDEGIFHALHLAWVSEIQGALNDGLLPPGFYALAEQHAGRTIPDVLTLHAVPPGPAQRQPLPDVGGTAVAQGPPRVRRRHTVEMKGAGHARTVAIRHVSGHRLVALMEIVSPANKDRTASVEEFSSKVVAALNSGVHVLVVDLFPPGRHDPSGMHGAVLQHLERSDQPYDLPGDEPLTLAAYATGDRIDVYLEHLAVGANLPDMPLFLHPERYVNIPLDSTYHTAYRGLPSFWRDVLDAPPAAR